MGELSVILREGRALPVWGTSLQSNPWCRILLDEQAVTSKRNKETSTRSDHKNPVRPALRAAPTCPLVTPQAGEPLVGN